MYAVIKSGGKQVRVAEGDVVRVERLTKEPLAKGAEVSLTEVLALGSDDGLHLGKPLVEGATVKGVVLRETRGPKRHGPITGSGRGRHSAKVARIIRHDPGVRSRCFRSSPMPASRLPRVQVLRSAPP